MASLSSGDAAAIIICSTVGAVALLVGLFLAFTGRCRAGCRQRQSANPFALRVSSAFAAEAAAYGSTNARARTDVPAASAASSDVAGRLAHQSSAVMDVAAPSSPSWAAGGVESSHPQPFSPSGEMTNPALPSPPASLIQPHSLADAPQAVSVTVLGLSAGGLSHKAEEARVADESTVSGASSSTVSADCRHASDLPVAVAATQSKPTDAAHHLAPSEPAAPTPSPATTTATFSGTETAVLTAERAVSSTLGGVASTTSPAAMPAGTWTDGPATPAGADASTTGGTAGSSAESSVTVHDATQAILSSGSGRSQPLLRVSSLDHATLFSYAQQAAVRSPEAEPAPAAADGVGAAPQPLAAYRDAAPQTSSRNVTRGRRYSNAPLPVGSPGGRIADLDHGPGFSPSDGAASSGLSSRRRSVVAPIDTGEGEGLVSVGTRSGASKAPVSRPVVPPEQVKIADHDDLDGATLVGVVVTPSEERSRVRGLGRTAGAGSRSFTDKSVAVAAAGGATAGCEEVHAYDQDIDVDNASALGLEDATAVHPECDPSKGERVYMMGVLSPQATSTSAAGSARRA